MKQEVTKSMIQEASSVLLNEGKFLKRLKKIGKTLIGGRDKEAIIPIPKGVDIKSPKLVIDQNGTEKKYDVFYHVGELYYEQEKIADGTESSYILGSSNIDLGGFEGLAGEYVYAHGDEMKTEENKKYKSFFFVSIIGKKMDIEKFAKEVVKSKPIGMRNYEF